MYLGEEESHLNINFDDNNFSEINEYYHNDKNLYEINCFGPNNNYNNEFFNDEKINNDIYLLNKNKSYQKPPIPKDDNEKDFGTFNIKTCYNTSTNHTTCENIPSYIPLDTIKNNLLCHSKNKDILDIIILGNNTKKCYKFLNQINDNNNYINENKNLFKVSKKNGRKYDLDEIVLKIKSNITIYIFSLINSLIKEIINNNKKHKLMPLKYGLISRPMDKIFNIKLLNQPIYTILSNDTSNKDVKKNYNIINNIINSNNKDYLIIKKALELTWGDYLDIFRYNYTPKLIEKIGKNILDEIKNKFDKIDSFMSELYVQKYDNDDEKNDYLSSVLLLTYNYERYFMLKKIRKPSLNKTIKKKKKK